MRADREKNVEIARRTTAHAGFALTGKPDAGAVLDAGRNVHCERAFAGHAAGAAARRARRVDRLAAAVAIRARPFQREEALGVAHASVTATHRASLRLGAGLGAGAGTGSASHRRRNADLRILADERFLKRNLHIVAQIRAALAAASAPASRRHSENAFEQVGECRAEIGAETRAAAHAMLERGMTKPVIGGALVRVFEDLVGFVDFLETVLGRLVAGIAIRMVLHRIFAKGSFNFAVARRAVDCQGLVIAALGHPLILTRSMPA